MNAPATNTPGTIDKSILTPLVCRALNHETLEVLDWQVDPLYGGSGNSEIFRFSGTAHNGNELLTWSLVLKIIRLAEDFSEPTSLRYWKREALAYQSSLLDNLPGKLSAPRCYGIVEQPNQEVWLWLEYLADDVHKQWSLDQFGNVARHLGEFNGIFFENTSAYSHPWMTKNQLRSWVGTDAPLLPPNVLAHPLVARFFPSNIYEWMQEIWSEHNTWMDFIECQPQTLSHLDVFRKNCFAKPDQHGELQTVMIDWAFVGSATPGEEIAPLVAASLNFMEADIEQARILDQIVFEGYLEGLRSAGWHGDPRVVRFAYAVGSILKFSVGVFGVAFMVADENQHPLLNQIFGHPVKELVDVWAQTNLFLYDLSLEVRQLASEL